MRYTTDEQARKYCYQFIKDWLMSEDKNLEDFRIEGREFDIEFTFNDEETFESGVEVREITPDKDDLLGIYFHGQGWFYCQECQ